jgi:prepilin-type N-terminal cleavage/methylation domain-containing protein
MTHFGLRIADCGFVERASLNPKSSIRNPQSRKGFTLLELLAAMSLMVVVSSCLYTALYTGFRAYQTAQTAVDPTLAAVNAIEVIKQDLRGVLPPGTHLAGSFIGTDASGIKGVDNDSVEFYTTHIFPEDSQTASLVVSAPLTDQATDTGVMGGIGKVELLLDEDMEAHDGTYLLLRDVTTNLLAPNEPVPIEQVLCRGVVSLNLRYYDGSDWVDGWDSTSTTDPNMLPLAVEVDLQISHRDKYSKELQKRRLVESFLVSCKTVPASTDTTGGTSSSGTKSSASSSSSSKSSSSSSSTTPNSKTNPS